MELCAGYSLVTIGSNLDIVAQAGIGITTFSHDDLTVPLGAAGSFVIEGSSEEHAHYLLGLRATKAVTENVSLVAGSNLKFLFPLSSPQPSYTFFGGVTIEIL
jgi:hypothetical protein